MTWYTLFASFKPEGPHMPYGSSMLPENYRTLAEAQAAAAKLCEGGRVERWFIEERRLVAGGPDVLPAPT